MKTEAIKISDPEFAPTGPLTLSGDEVQLWQVDLAAVVKRENYFRRLLPLDEQARADRLHAARDRQSFIATRAILRMLLGAYLNRDPGAVVFQYSEKGKPGIEGVRVKFNVSHSGDRALLAFADDRIVGVDIESVRKDFDCTALANRFFSTHEQAALAALPSQERFAGFFRCWTRKESYIKALAGGLSIPLHEFDVSVVPGDQDALLAIRSAGDGIQWTIREVSVDPGYAAALCIQKST